MMDDNFTAETSDAGAKMTEALDVVIAAAKRHMSCLRENLPQGYAGEDEHRFKESARIGQAIAVLNGEA